jgi:hypothetical protein
MTMSLLIRGFGEFSGATWALGVLTLAFFLSPLCLPIYALKLVSPFCLHSYFPNMVFSFLLLGGFFVTPWVCWDC